MKKKKKEKIFIIQIINVIILVQIIQIIMIILIIKYKFFIKKCLFYYLKLKKNIKSPLNSRSSSFRNSFFQFTSGDLYLNLPRYSGDWRIYDNINTNIISIIIFFYIC